MESRNWVIVGQRLLEVYTLFKTSIDFRSLPTDLFYCACAPFGGPIALLYNPKHESAKQYSLPERTADSVLIFDSRGERKKAVSFTLRDRLIKFQFTSEENLLIVEACGVFHLLNTHSYKLTTGTYFPVETEPQISKSRCFGAHIMSDQMLLLREKQLGLIKGLVNPYWEPLTRIKLHTANPIFKLQLSKEGSLGVYFLSKDYDILFYDLGKETTIDIWKNPFLKKHKDNIIALSIKGTTLALVTHSPSRLTLVDLSESPAFEFGHEPCVELYEPRLSSVSKNGTRYSPDYALEWINDCAVFSNTQLFIVFNFDSMYLFAQPHRLIAEVDGVKALGDECTIIRSVSQEYQYLSELHELGPTAPESMLARIVFLQKTLEQFKNHQLISLTELATHKSAAQELVDLICNCGGLCIEPSRQMRMLRLASFVQTAYSAGSMTMYHLCGELRIVNSLRYSQLRRILTLEQYLYLKTERRKQMLNLLLRNGMYFMADIIFTDSAAKEAILTHWAQIKIHKEPQDTALEFIRQKLTAMKQHFSSSTRVYVDMAKYCADRGKFLLAFEFIKFETNPDKRAVSSICVLSRRKDSSSATVLEQYPQLLPLLVEYLEKVTMSSLLVRMIETLLTWVEAKQLFPLVRANKNVHSHLITLLQTQGEQQMLTQLYKYERKYEALGYDSLSSRAFSKEGISHRQIMSEYLKVLPSLATAITKVKSNTGLTILQELMRKQTPIVAQDIVGLVSDMDFEYAAQAVLDKDKNEQLFAEVISRIKSERAYALLMRRGKIEKVINLAYARKDKQYLAQLVQSCPQEHSQLLSLKINQLKKSRN